MGPRLVASPISGFYTLGAHGDRFPAPSGDLGDAIFRRLVNSPSRSQVLLRHQAQVINMLDLVGFVLYCKIRAGPDSGYPVSQNLFMS